LFGDILDLYHRHARQQQSEVVLQEISAEVAAGATARQVVDGADGEAVELTRRRSQCVPFASKGDATEGGTSQQVIDAEKRAAAGKGGNTRLVLVPGVGATPPTQLAG
jgi:hypothetical protein